MRQVRAFFLRAAELFRKEKREQEFAAELESNLQLHIDENLRRGMNLEEARRVALLKLGGTEQTKEIYRDRRGHPMLEILWQDTRYALRMLRKNPGFTVVVILMLTLGIGANTAIFSVVNAAIFRPFPFVHPERLVAVYQKTSQFEESSVSYMDILDWQKDNRSFAALSAWRRDTFNLTGSGEAEQYQGLQTSASFMPLLGVQPILGRYFSEAEDQLGAAPVVLISERVWRNRFGGAQDILGKNLTLNGKDYAVVGVVPATFHWYRDSDVFYPIGQWDSEIFRTRGLSQGTQVIALMKPGVTIAQANADMVAVAANLARTYPDALKGTSAVVVPLREDAVGDIRPLLLVLLGAVGFVLLIACANVANLLLARSAARAREFAIRTAIGASRNRVIRQMLTESLLLSMTGGVLGILLAMWGTQAALKLLPATLPGIVRLDLDMRVLLFALGASLLTGLLFGLAPAWKTVRPNLQETLKEGGRGMEGGRHRAQGIFIVSEIALAMILLVGAGLMLRSLGHLWNVKLGFDPRNVTSFEVALPPSSKPDAVAIREKNNQLLERLQALPGIEAASVVFGSLPMSGDSEIPFWLEGQPKPTSQNDMSWSLMYGVSPGYFRAMKIPLLAGRTISAQDSHTAPLITVIDEEFARQHFPGQDPVGKRLNLIILGQAEIVGVVGHVNHWGLDSDDTAKIRSQLYLAFAQFPDQAMTMGANGADFVVRASVPSAAMLQSVRKEISSIDNRQIVNRVSTMEDIVTASQAQRRFSMLLLNGFAAIALLLAMVGIYGVVSYLVNQRTHEVGIRMAMGARPRDILRIVLGSGSKMALAGIAIGLCASFALTRLMARLLFGVSATDPLTFGGVALLLFGIALAACYLPARRAMRVDPMVALRYE
ncbi:MAG TPA: ABC transporter permease [Candidatus Saccharimonadales bacterium]|nr:ABC transporter permease [Candidatus Saccharimonadales bacterium]